MLGPRLNDLLDIFLVCPPGLEGILREETLEAGFAGAKTVPGGVTFTAQGWGAVWRANLVLRGATRVLVRVGEFYAGHLSQLDKRAHQIPWGQYLAPGAGVRVEASCRKSKIYHSGAAAERVARAIADAMGVNAHDETGRLVMVRFERDTCTVSVDMSGEPLHKRGFRQAVGKAPLRESLAALLLRACRYQPGEPVVDPMCGAGTLVLEAAERAAALAPGRARAFAFETAPDFDDQRWAAMRARVASKARQDHSAPVVFGFDRNATVIDMAIANAGRASVAELTRFAAQPISALEPPTAERGLVIVNPPYGERIGEKSQLIALYQAFGGVMRARFSGWRVGLVTSDDALAKATGLPFDSVSAPIPHGGLKVRLHQAQLAET